MFQDFSEAASARAPGSPVLDQACHLINRYPGLDEAELQRLIGLYRDLSALDVALMMADQNLAPRLEQFMEDHRSEVRTPISDYALLMAIVACGVLLVFWASLFA